MGHIPYWRDVYAAKGSGVTSEIVYIGDAIDDSVNVLVAGDSASSTTVQISTADGRASAIPANSWSNHSVIANPNAYVYVTDIPEGYRWLRTLRNESGTTVNVSFQGRG